MKFYTIYVPPPVLHWLWWYIYTFKIAENKYFPIDFVRKDWEYPAQIYVIFPMYFEIANLSNKPSSCYDSSVNELSYQKTLKTKHVYIYSSRSGIVVFPRIRV